MHGICDQPGCLDSAERRPVIQVSARPPRNTLTQTPSAKPLAHGAFNQGIDGPTRYVVEYAICHEFCEFHAESFRWQKFVNEACWSAIENQLSQSGFAPPSKDDVTVRWEIAAGADGLDDIGRQWLAARKGLSWPDQPSSAFAARSS